MSTIGRRPGRGLGRPLKLSIEEHEDLIRRKVAGESAEELSVRFGIAYQTVYSYLRMRPESRYDAVPR